MSFLPDAAVPPIEIPVPQAALEAIMPLTEAYRRDRADPISVWPYAPGPVGPLRFGNGAAAHGSYLLDLGCRDGLVLCVANNGWPLQADTVPGPNPGVLGSLDPCSAWVAQQPSLVDAGLGDRVLVLPPEAGAIERVATCNKPMALVDTDDAGQLERWRTIAQLEGLAIRVTEEELSGPIGPTTVWFAAVARREPFRELVELDKVAEYYEAVFTNDPRRNRIAASMAVIEAESPTDYLDRVDDLIVAPFGDLIPGGCPTEVTGIVLGYWPPTSAAMIHATQCDGYVEPPAVVDLAWWDDVRLGMAQHD